MRSISNPIPELRERIARAAQSAGRSPDSVRLVAASKTQSPQAIARVADAGVVDFGENYVNEALPKIAALAHRKLTWHFIGAIQSNKTAEIAQNFHWVHTLDRLKVAQRLSRQRSASAAPLDVLVQINIDAESTKAGIAPEALAEFAKQLLPLPHLRLRGLMAIPKPTSDPVRQAAAFARLRTLFDATQPAGAQHWDTLSMGMTSDFETAIREGATMIRIGTAIFGPRAVRADV
jgi:pyridoxal phosphate enzyme (YggS family)